MGPQMPLYFFLFLYLVFRRLLSGPLCSEISARTRPCLCSGRSDWGAGGTQQPFWAGFCRTVAPHRLPPGLASAGAVGCCRDGPVLLPWGASEQVFPSSHCADGVVSA